MQKAKQIITICLVVLVAILVFQNIDTVTTKFLIWSFQLPHVVLLLCVFLIGVLAGKFIKFRKK